MSWFGTNVAGAPAICQANISIEEALRSMAGSTVLNDCTASL
jgi:hypothetical protein